MLANQSIHANDVPDANAADAVTADPVVLLPPVPAYLIMLAGLAEYVRAAAATLIAERPSDDTARNYALMAVRHIDDLLALALGRYGTWFVFNDAIRFVPLPGSPPDFKREPVAARKSRIERAKLAEGAREPKVYAAPFAIVGPDGGAV